MPARAGAGHFVKMIHNGIEYGLMQAYAEGFDILDGKASRRTAGRRSASTSISPISPKSGGAAAWSRPGFSIWPPMALAEDPALADFSGAVAGLGEGRWTVEAAVEEAVPAEVLAAALFARFRSRRTTLSADKLLSAMRSVRRPCRTP